MSKIVQERYQLKQPQKKHKLLTRANVMISVLFAIIVVLGWVYLAQR